MEIKLFVEEQEKKYTVRFIKARMFRRVIELNKKYDLNNLDLEGLDALVDFVVDCFEGQFTRDEFYDGVSAPELMDILLDFVQTVSGIGGTSNDPNPQMD